jgi:Holliday junction resolvase RusA-like endonuclease
MAEITFTVPGAPASKGRPRFDRRTGRAYTPETTVTAENWIRWHATQAAEQPLNGALFVSVTAHFPIPKSWPKGKQAEAVKGLLLPITGKDADNIAKACCDAMNGVAYIDDAQIVELRVTKRYAAEPRTIITIREI